MSSIDPEAEALKRGYITDPALERMASRAILRGVPLETIVEQFGALPQGLMVIARSPEPDTPRADDSAGRPRGDRSRLGTRTPGAVIRTADVSEAGELTELTVRSKASWGYDDAFMQQVHGDLVVTAEAIASGRVMVAERRSRIVGYYQLHLAPPNARLDDLFVDPEHHGSGLGRLLWEHASSAALEHHCTTMTLEADPNAESLYRHLGAHRTGTTETFPGRLLPVMTYQLYR